jgi:hypothetical protein
MITSMAEKTSCMLTPKLSGLIVRRFIDAMTLTMSYEIHHTCCGRAGAVKAVCSKLKTANEYTHGKE